MKGPAGKPVGGVYCNPRVIHTAASLLGNIVRIQVKNGSIYEGVFRTFSPKVDIVLEMVVKLEKKSSTMASVLSNGFEPQLVTEKMIFNFSDIIALSAVNVDMDYLARTAGSEFFTDSAISRFNGQVQERVLEPWDGGASSDTLTDLEAEEIANGWAADEMFRTNEVKYGVKSSFKDDLKDYTIPLKKQNTEEYKQQEAKASKIAQEIESGFHHKSRAALENGDEDEEDKFSAVVRPDNNNCATNSGATNNNRFVPHRARKPQGPRPVRSSPSPNAHTQSRVTHPQGYLKPSLQQNQAHAAPSTKTTPSRSAGISPPLPKPSPMHSLPSRQGPSSQPQASSLSNASCSSPSPVSSSSSPLTVPDTSKEISSKDPCIKDIKPEVSQLQKNIDRPKEVNEKKSKRSAFDEKAEELKQFHAKFKIKEMLSDSHDDQTTNSHKSSSPSLSELSELNVSSNEGKEISNIIPEEEKLTNSRKGSTLNPNAKEFVLNPNAKTFTPRGLATSSASMAPPPPPPPVQPPPRLHAQSPVIALPPAHLMPAIPPAMYNVGTPHYVLPATPVSVPIAPPYTPATSMAQAPRYRKVVPRNDSSQPIHVQAATGQPILAPPTLSTSQFAIQYAPSPGLLHTGGPPQPPLAYTQMLMHGCMVGPRVITPQPLGMVSAAATYGENPHVPTQIYMNPQAVSNVSHPGGPTSNSNQHSTPSTPQSQTPNLHTASSPVQQAAPPPSAHGQTSTPAAQSNNPPAPPVVYHGQFTAQHPLHLNPASNHSHPYPAMYGGGPQPIMLLPQQPLPGPHHPATFSTLQNHFHAQTPGAHGTAPQIIPHPSVAMMQTSSGMTHAPVSISSSHHFIPHSQV